MTEIKSDYQAKNQIYEIEKTIKLFIIAVNNVSMAMKEISLNISDITEAIKEFNEFPIINEIEADKLLKGIENIIESANFSIETIFKIKNMLIRNQIK